MSNGHDPEIVHLDRARRAKAERAKAEAALRKQAGRQPVLGSRRGAGVILVLVIVVLLALWLGPALL
jgi:hypothetical protein